MTILAIPLKKSSRITKSIALISLATGISFFSYSAYAGVILNHGADQIWIGVTVLSISLGIRLAIERFALDM